MNLRNYDTIYFNGCSFTEGGGFEAGKRHIHAAYKEKYGFEYKNEKEVCYPTIVQTLLPNIKVINEAKSGAGTERLIRKVWEYIFSRRLEDVQKTIFILELPGAVTRLDLFSVKHFKELVGNIEYDNSGKIKDTQVVFDWIYGPSLQEEYRNKLRRIIREYSEEFMHPEIQDKKVAYSLFGLANFMMMHNIEFYFTGDTSYTEYQLNLQYDYPTFNSEHILQLNIGSKKYNNIVHMAGETKTQIGHEVGFDVTTDGHPGFQAHKAWGEAIVDFLNNKYLYKIKYMRYKEQIRKHLENMEIRVNYLKQATEGSKPITPADAIKMIDEVLYSLGKVNELVDLEREG